MAVIIMSIVVTLIIAFGASYFLSAEHTPAWEVYSTSSTRVGDPGENLVGPAWTGSSSVASATEPEAPPS
ncbi:hypothetical protein EET67_20785 [Pseudaminobacter arsenicus]|uniref:Uncharacterized protein n=1 Tax=Borborobacter arsenicus TaxID=1851146 RepID=A0A432V0X1_9HYPH|nr:hypothetical protein EET67_20785 [Pseudaminobacter arsenicus]